MSFYEERILPHLINLAMRNRNLVQYRARVVSAAQGRVLEIGIGSGLNLPFYRPSVSEVIGLDPSLRLTEMARRRVGSTPPPVTFVEGSAEAIPLEDRSVDTVLTTWSLCSIPGVMAALAEMRRVLRPAGQLSFVEHGQAPEPDVRRWQDRLNPVWKRIGGGCHLNRPIRSLIEAASFDIASIETAYAKGPRPMTFMYEGRARPT